MTSSSPDLVPGDHVQRLDDVLDRSRDAFQVAAQWGSRLAEILPRGHRLLVAGNGGSAAQAQHLTAELVGRYRADRQPFSAVSLHAETSSLTAIANDYGIEEMFARQVEAHGRPGDVCLLLSTSGASPNLLAAARRARELGLEVWAMTGRAPNPLAALADQVLVIDSDSCAATQEAHLVALHIVCEQLDADLLGPAEVAAVHLRAPTRGEPATTRLVVVGDVLLDVDVHADANRLTPDSAAPVLEETARSCRAGGAALAALLAARRGGVEVTLIAPLAADDDGDQIRGLLDPRIELVTIPCRGETRVKTRLRARGHTVARLDRGAGVAVTDLPDAARQRIAEASCVLVSDYGGGTTTFEPLREALGAAAVSRPMVWDPHPRGAAPVSDVLLVTPNEPEAAALSGLPTEPGLSGVRRQAERLAAAWQARCVVVTRGSNGALMYAADGSASVFPAAQSASGDTCGAGDCFAATAANALAVGASPSEAVAAAVAAATAYVVTGGVADLGAEQTPYQSDDKSAQQVVDEVRARGGTVVATGGCFDLLHAGHIQTLAAARALGDCLVVCLNSDASVRRLKGPERPLQPGTDRALVLAALRHVDAVVVFDEDTPLRVLGELRPDVWVKGGDYAGADLPEAAVLREWGGEVLTVPYLDGRSTSTLAELVGT